MTDIIKVADHADMIINGYAFTKNMGKIRVLNLNNPNKAIILDNQGTVWETSMDDIEIQIVKEYFEKNKEFLED